MFALNSAENRPDSPAAANVLLVQIAGEIYALPASSVREVIRYRACTPVPGAPPALPGILSQRGAILPVVDAHPLLGLDPTPITRATRMVVLGHADVDLAVLVEAVLDLVSLPGEAIEPLPATLDPARARFLRGVVQQEDQAIALFDLDEMIAGLRA